MPKGYPNPKFEEQIDENSFSTAVTTNLLAAEAAAEFTAELTRNQPMANDINKAWPHFAYWKYCVDETCFEPGHIDRRGWIMVGPSKIGQYGPPQCQEYSEAYHAESLEDKYGPLAQNQPNVPGPRILQEIPGKPAAWAEALFMQPGGFYEMPKSQWKALKLHKSPRLAKYRPDVTPADFIECDLCAQGSREFVERSHLDAHQDARHPEQRSSIAVASAMGRVMNEREDSNQNSIVLQLAAQIADLQSQLNAKKEN